MNLEDIQKQWEKDCSIDRSELGNESLRIPDLHNKYYKMFMEERSTLREWERALAVFMKLKHQYYLGILPEEDMKRHNWTPNALKILRQDLPLYLESDKELLEAKKKIAALNDKVEYLEAIIKSFANRGYHIKTALDWQRFITGS